ncbi:alpha/beta hydrolase [Streptomyces axinellae]|uniref:Peptidase S33 tripeptidyl aminopeptidase-like C-terminal domain-containing protein n=1 Tax=Streptomyces axinellae TaxID=552788 RepID=A0ABP6CG56_9ACTN
MTGTAHVTASRAAPVPAPAAGQDATAWHPPPAVAPRGTLLVLPGRGEHPGVYERFGRRLAADGYVVHALELPPDAGTAEVRAAIRSAAGDEPAAPLVLVGADTGALQALHTAESLSPAAPGPPLAGVVAAAPAPVDTSVPAAAPASGPDTEAGGTGGAEAPRKGGADTAWESELDARTVCPVHRARLTADASFERGALSGPVPDRLRGRAYTALPVLVLHGAADPVTPLAQARDLAARLPLATLGVLREGRHDVLNDASHRSAAAALVLWLERLRGGPLSPPVLTLEAAPAESTGPADTAAPPTSPISPAGPAAPTGPGGPREGIA